MAEKIRANEHAVSPQGIAGCLIDLTLEPPRVVDTVSFKQPQEGVAISRTGKLVGVSVMNGSNKATDSPFFHAHRSFMLLSVERMKLTKVSEVPTGGWTQGVAFSPGGQTVLVQNTMQKEIEVIAIDGAHATDIGRRLRFDSAPSGMRAMNAQQRENGS